MEASDPKDATDAFEALESTEFCDASGGTAEIAAREATEAIEPMEAIDSRELCDAMVVVAWKNKPAATVESVSPAESERIALMVRSFWP